MMSFRLTYQSPIRYHTATVGGLSLPRSKNKVFLLENRMTCKCEDDGWLSFRQVVHQVKFRIYDLRKWAKKNPHNMKWIRLGART